MDEIETLHNRSLEWGCVCNLIDKIGSLEEQQDEPWDELLDMVADMIDEEGREEDPTKIFFIIYPYCFRLYYRLRANPEKRTFNQISRIGISGNEFFRITNYDYKMFKWAMAGGLTERTTNDYIDLPSDKLTDKQRRAFERRCKKDTK